GCSQGIADGIALLGSVHVPAGVVLVHRTTGGGDSSRGSSAQSLRSQEETTTVQHAVRRRRRANREGNHAVLRRRAGEGVLQQRAGQRPGDGKGEGPRCDHHSGLDPGDVPPRHRAHPQRRQLVKTQLFVSWDPSRWPGSWGGGCFVLPGREPPRPQRC
ncbi:unnamed protein product, partial [Ectocarpus sp. 8 AP-2014]